MSPSAPVRYSMLRHPIRALEARTARDPFLRKTGKIMKYLAPVLGSATFASIFAATPGVTSITGLVVWAMLGAVPSGLASWGVSQAFKNAGAERELQPYNRVAAQLLRAGRVSRDELERRGVDISSINEAVMIGKRSLFQRILGMGGMAVTIHVEDTRLNEPKALKVPLPELLSMPEALARFVAEARGLCKMHNKRIVRFFNLEYMKRETYIELLDAAIEYAKQDGWERDDLAVDVADLPEEIPYIDMEFIQGNTLSGHTEAGPIPLPDGLKIGMELLEALKYMHSKNVVHRDLKPDNIFVVQDPESPEEITLKIIDFGLIKNVQPAADPNLSTPQLTQLGVMMGSPTWMSPEQIQGVSDIDWRTDLYAAGLIIFNILSCRMPFKGWDTIETVYDIHQYNALVTKSQPLDIRQLVADAPESLAYVLDRMLATNRDDRYQSPQECLSDLQLVYQEVLDQATGRATQLGGPGQGF